MDTRKRKKKKWTSAEEKRRWARFGGRGSRGCSGVGMRKEAVWMREIGMNAGKIHSELQEKYPSVKIPGKRPLQRRIQGKESCW